MTNQQAETPCLLSSPLRSLQDRFSHCGLLLSDQHILHNTTTVLQYLSTKRDPALPLFFFFFFLFLKKKRKLSLLPAHGEAIWGLTSLARTPWILAKLKRALRFTRSGTVGESIVLVSTVPI